jgi:hypothetical protein
MLMPPEEARSPPLRLRLALGLLAVVLGAALWLPSLRLFFRQDVRDVFEPRAVNPLAAKLASRQRATWTDPALREAAIDQLRRSNAEWDFMGRSFLVWSLANLALRDPAMKAANLEVMDRIIEETLRLEAAQGFTVFLMPYAHRAPYLGQPARSLFVDGEVALMLALRQVVEERADYREPLSLRVEAIATAMRAGPVLSAESYPNECWTFDQANALAALRLADVLTHSDHSGLIRDWLAAAREKLIDPRTGLLVSSFTYDGRPLDGPEGSSIWMIVHALELVDPVFAADQYRRAKAELSIDVLGFGMAREWPRSWRGPSDIDSGLSIPLLGASPSSSGLAMVAATTFGDEAALASLLSSLEYGGFPVEDPRGLHYAVGNPVGDAVLLYALSLGPVRREVERRGRP